MTEDREQLAQQALGKSLCCLGSKQSCRGVQGSLVLAALHVLRKHLLQHSAALRTNSSRGRAAAS
jgi:hypothetical protein